MHRSSLRLLAPTLILLLASGCAELGGIDFSPLLGAGPLSSGTVASGLKEALETGTSRAATTLSADGGFSRDPLLRIGLPDSLQTLASAMRTVGFGAKVDAFERQMNLAAEKAAGEAVPVFAAAVKGMTVEDAFAILDGPKDAATQYFQGKTSAALRARFEPVVQQSMEKAGVYTTYRSLIDRYDAIPLTKPPTPDLEGYITNKTLSGLFGKLAEEEARIREDPLARSSSLLKKVFDPNAVRAAVPSAG